MASSQQSIRVRIAPSPTGRLHIGTARTALFNYLFAKKQGGSFILRIEDTDLERSDPEFEKDILEQLKWLGIEWDEGVGVGGPYAPYRQSERTASYKMYLQKLLDDDKTYWCFCSEEMLAAERERAQAEGKAPRYSGKCRGVARAEAERRRGAGERAILRFKTPENRKITFRDLIRGELTFDTAHLDDFSIGKAVDVPLYNFAVVVDDFEMQISHVIRGEDHISNTPKQLLIIEALGFPVPQYAHLPLILGADRSKMSKRHGAVSVAEYRAQGYLPEALFNFIALLGWNPNTDEEVLSKKEIIEKFSLEGVQKAGAIFNIEKLDWMSGIYIRQMPENKLVESIKPFLDVIARSEATKQSIPLSRFPGQIPYIGNMDTAREMLSQSISPTPRPESVGARNDETLLKIIALCKDRMKKLSDFVELSEFFFKEPSYDKEFLRWKDMDDAAVNASLKKIREWIQAIPENSFEEKTIDEMLQHNVTEKKGEIFWPLRVALTGRKASPPPAPIMAILGKTETLKRIERVLQFFV